MSEPQNPNPMVPVVPSSPDNFPLVEPGRHELGQRRPIIWTTLPREKPEDKRLIMRCMQSEDLKMGQAINTVFPVSNLLCHPASSINPDDGTVAEFTRTVLVGPDGKTLSCGSEGILRGLELLIDLYGMPPWNPPLPLTFKSMPSKGGRHYYIVDVADVLPQSKKGR